MAKILSVCNRLLARDYENGNGCKRRVSRLTQFIHTTLHFSFSSYFFVYVCVCMCVSVCQSQICIMHDCLKIQVNSTNTHGFQAKTKTRTQLRPRQDSRLRFISWLCCAMVNQYYEKKYTFIIENLGLAVRKNCKKCVHIS